MQKIKVLILIIFVFISCAKKPELKLTTDSDFEKAFSDANKLIGKTLYDDARDLLNKIKTMDTTGKYAPLAQLRFADSYLKEEEPELAIEEFKQFLDIYPGHTYAAYAQFQLAMAYFNRIKDPERGYGDAEDALEEFEKLKLIYPRNPYRDVIDQYIEKCKETIADHEFLVGNFYYKKKAYKGAIERFLGILERFPDYKKEADVLYNLWSSYKGLGDEDNASRYLSLLINKYPESKLIKKTQRVSEPIKKDK